MHNDQPHPTEELSMDAILAQESIELHKADLARKDAEIESMALRFLRSLQPEFPSKCIAKHGQVSQRKNHPEIWSIPL